MAVQSLYDFGFHVVYRNLRLCAINQNIHIRFSLEPIIFSACIGGIEVIGYLFQFVQRIVYLAMLEGRRAKHAELQLFHAQSFVLRTADAAHQQGGGYSLCQIIFANIALWVFIVNFIGIARSPDDVGMYHRFPLTAHQAGNRTGQRRQIGQVYVRGMYQGLRTRQRATSVPQVFHDGCQ